MDTCFFTVLGNDDVKNCFRDLSLLKNNLVLPIVEYRFSTAHLGEKLFWVKWGFAAPHKAFPARATAKAVDECVITRLEKATMIDMVHKEPEFSELFILSTDPEQPD